MVLSDLEVVLFIAFGIILYMYFTIKARLGYLEAHVWHMAKVISRIADGEVKAIRINDKMIEIKEN